MVWCIIHKYVCENKKNYMNYFTLLGTRNTWEKLAKYSRQTAEQQRAERIASLRKHHVLQRVASFIFKKPSWTEPVFTLISASHEAIYLKGRLTKQQMSTLFPARREFGAFNTEWNTVVNKSDICFFISLSFFNFAQCNNISSMRQV